MSNNPSKILYVAEVFLPGRKASSIHVMRMCKAMADQGYKVRLLAYRSPEYQNNHQLFDYYGVEPNFGIKVLQVPGKGRLASFILAFIAFFQVILFRPKIAYTRSVISAFTLSLVARAFVLESHTFITQARRTWLFLFRKFIKRRSFVGMVVISDAMRKMYSNRGISESVMFVAHDAADEKPLDDKSKLQGDYDFNAGYFGSIFKGRGIEIIIKMAENRAKVGFHIFGASQNDLNGNHKVPSNLFFYGFIPPSGVHVYRNACDVLLAPYQPEVFVSRKEAFSTSLYMSPLKIFEYMSAGKAMIVSDMPVLREVLSNETALLVTPDAPEEWIGALDRLQNDGVLNERMGKSAYNEFLKNYTWHRRAALILNWLERRLKQGEQHSLQQNKMENATRGSG